MTPHCRTAAEALANSPLAGLIDKARLLGQISRLVATFGREATGSEHSSSNLHCFLEGSTVVISVGNSAQAAKLRQRSNALIQLLQECNAELTGIRFRLQPGGADDAAGKPAVAASADPQKRNPDELAAALKFAEDLSRDLHDSPLRRSAQRLHASLQARLKPPR